MAGNGRIWQLDAARSAALVAMAVYHFAYDLEMFGLVAPGTVLSGGWYWLARGTAASFLFLAGVSLWLAHGGGVAWRPALRRLAAVGGAAAAISAATWFAMPDRWVFFGILHAIAFGSVAGLAVLRLPWPAIAGLAAAVVFIDRQVAAPVFDLAGVQFLGLGTVVPLTVDYVPVFPWFAAVLAGIAAARAAEDAGLWQALRAAPPPGPGLRRLGWPGRHSLAIYLLHQPVLIGGIWAWLRITG
ncbi:MAG: DUF1624 domain-containing protein [Paracoccaceae bacterium]|nr:MAG: DUF1624 domain-containing protein [Paracoccaceae bacterium]